MPVSRTVAQTVNALVKSYKQDIETAARDNVLSKAEQAKLSSFAKGHIDELRQGGKPVTVTKAVAHLKPILTRAAKAIAGSDGMIDAADVKKLRVAELRTRASSLFESASGGSVTALKAAMKKADIPMISDFGKAFDLTEFPASASFESVVAKFSDITADDMGPIKDWAKVTNGPAAVSAFVSTVRQAGKDQTEDVSEADQVRTIKGAFDGVADAAISTFKPSDYTKIVGLQHEIAEDGDLEQNLLLAQKKTGGWVALKYTDFPF